MIMLSTQQAACLLANSTGVFSFPSFYFFLLSVFSFALSFSLLFFFFLFCSFFIYSFSLSFSFSHYFLLSYFLSLCKSALQCTFVE